MEATTEKDPVRKRRKVVKSRHVREVIAELGPGASAADVRERLSTTRKIKVSLALVHQVKNKMQLQNETGPKSEVINLGTLLKAKQAISKIGTIAEAKRAVLLLERLNA